ncbi:MAG: OsmC family protein [Pirellulales bacterium]
MKTPQGDSTSWPRSSVCTWANSAPRSCTAPATFACRSTCPSRSAAEKAAPSPTDLLAGALGTCLLSTLGLIARRRSWDLAGARAEVVKETDDAANRISALRTTIRIPGGGRFSPDDRAKLERATGACTVHRSLHPDIDAPVTFVWEEV